MVNKYQKWVDLAHAVDQWRIFPRIFISTYIYLLYKVVTWYMALPNPTLEQSGLVSFVVGAEKAGNVNHGVVMQPLLQPKPG